MQSLTSGKLVEKKHEDLQLDNRQFTEIVERIMPKEVIITIIPIQVYTITVVINI